MSDREIIPNGVYQAKIVDVFKSVSKAGNNMVTWTLQLLTPEYRGIEIKKFNVIRTEDNKKWLKVDLSKCGANSKEYRGLTEDRFNDYLSRLKGVCLEIKKQTKGKYVNIFFNKKIDPPEEATKEQEEIPF